MSAVPINSAPQLKVDDCFALIKQNDINALDQRLQEQSLSQLKTLSQELDNQNYILYFFEGTKRELLSGKIEGAFINRFQPLSQLNWQGMVCSDIGISKETMTHTASKSSDFCLYLLHEMKGGLYELNFLEEKIQKINNLFEAVDNQNLDPDYFLLRIASQDRKIVLDNLRNHAGFSKYVQDKNIAGADDKTLLVLFRGYISNINRQREINKLGSHDGKPPKGISAEEYLALEVEFELLFGGISVITPLSGEDKTLNDIENDGHMLNKDMEKWTTPVKWLAKTGQK